MSPEWALQDGDPMCKLPKRDYWIDFANFVQAVIDRYHPKYIEIWNEPDVFYDWMNPDHIEHYGCVGDGALYGEFVDKLHSHLHGAKIIVGAVSDAESAFLTHMLIEAKGHFHGVSFHCYETYFDEIGDTCIPQYEELSEWIGAPVYLSETNVRYDGGDFPRYENYAQPEYYDRLKRALETEWFIYTVNYNGWPTTTVGCFKANVDMVGKNICTNETYHRPVWYEYIQE